MTVRARDEDSPPKQELPGAEGQRGGGPGPRAHSDRPRVHRLAAGAPPTSHAQVRDSQLHSEAAVMPGLFVHPPTRAGPSSGVRRPRAQASGFRLCMGCVWGGGPVCGHGLGLGTMTETRQRGTLHTPCRLSPLPPAPHLGETGSPTSWTVTSLNRAHPYWPRPVPAGASAGAPGPRRWRRWLCCSRG